MYFRSTVNIATVSYQYCACLYYCETHLLRYIQYCCPFIYCVSVVFNMCYFTLPRIFAFLLNVDYFICGIFEQNYFASDKEINNL